MHPAPCPYPRVYDIQGSMPDAEAFAVVTVRVQPTAWGLQELQRGVDDTVGTMLSVPNVLFLRISLSFGCIDDVCCLSLLNDFCAFPQTA